MSGAASPAGGRQEELGRGAVSPWSIPAAGWKDVALRAWREADNDNISLIAPGVAFYGFLAMVPLLGAIVLSYGLVADRPTVIKHVQSLTSVMPTDAAKLIGEQLLNVVKTSGSKKGVGLLVAMAIALYGAMKGAGALVIALNIAYNEEDNAASLRATGLRWRSPLLRCCWHFWQLWRLERLVISTRSPWRPTLRARLRQASFLPADGGSGRGGGRKPLSLWPQSKGRAVDMAHPGVSIGRKLLCPSGTAETGRVPSPCCCLVAMHRFWAQR